MPSNKAIEIAEELHPVPENKYGLYSKHAYNFAVEKVQRQRLRAATLIDAKVAPLVDAVKLSVDEMYCTKTSGRETTEYCTALFEQDEWCGQCSIEAAAEPWEVE